MLVRRLRAAGAPYALICDVFGITKGTVRRIAGDVAVQKRAVRDDPEVEAEPDQPAGAEPGPEAEPPAAETVQLPEVAAEAEKPVEVKPLSAFELLRVRRPLMSTGDVARRLGVNSSTVMILARTGELPCVGQPGRRRYTPEDVEELARRRGV